MARGWWMAAILFGCGVPASGGFGVGAPPTESSQWIVGLDASATDPAGLLASGGTPIVRWEATLRLATVTAGPSAVAVLAALPGVLFVEPNRPLELLGTPNDPLWAQQWGPQRIHVAEARDLEVGSPDTLVAVLDTGLDYRLPELEPRVWNENGDHGFNVQSASHVAYCPTYLEMDAKINCEKLLLEDDRLKTPMDFHGHGTHVAGTIAAIADEGMGVAGVARVGLLPIKVIGTGITTTDMLAAAIVLATDAGADVINMSLGACYAMAPPNSFYSTSLGLAVDYAWTHGVVLVAAAGNNDSALPCWPAAYENVISVAATSPGDAAADFSNFGPTIDLAGPGVDVLSTQPRWFLAFGSQFVPSSGGGHWLMSGTSMAAPHVAGVAGLVKSARPDLTNAEIRNVLEATAEDLGEPGRDDLYGHGLVDAHAAVQAALAL